MLRHRTGEEEPRSAATTIYRSASWSNPPQVASTACLVDPCLRVNGAAAWIYAA